MSQGVSVKAQLCLVPLKGFNKTLNNEGDKATAVRFYMLRCRCLGCLVSLLPDTPGPAQQLIITP